MNRTSRTVRLAFAVAALAITGTLFQTVASFAQPTAIEQTARAKVNAVTVAGVESTTSTAGRSGAR